MFSVQHFRYYNFLRVTKQGLLAFTLQSAVEINVKKSVDFWPFFYLENGSTDADRISRFVLLVTQSQNSKTFNWATGFSNNTELRDLKLKLLGGPHEDL